MVGDFVFALENLFGHEIPPDEVAIIVLTIASLTIFVFTIILSISIRSYRIWKDKNESEFREISSSIVSNYLFSETNGFNNWTKLYPQPDSITFLNKINGSRYSEIVIDILGKLEESFSGEYSGRINLLYQELGLHRYSLKLINSIFWYKKAKGVRQLSSMKYADSYNVIYKLIYSPKALLRNEVQLALINFKGNAALSFLDNYRYQISEFQQFCILERLSLSKVSVEVKKEWVFSENPSILSLANKLIRQYKLIEHSDMLKVMLDHPDPSIVIETIKTISEIQAIETKGKLLEKYHQYSSFEKIEVIKAIGIIGGVDDLPFLETNLFSSYTDLSIQAGYSILNFGEVGERLLLKIKAENSNSENLMKVINHVMDKLI